MITASSGRSSRHCSRNASTSEVGTNARRLPSAWRKWWEQSWNSSNRPEHMSNRCQPGHWQEPLGLTVHIALLTAGYDKPYAVPLSTALAQHGVRIDFIGSDELNCREVTRTS